MQLTIKNICDLISVEAPKNCLGEKITNFCELKKSREGGITFLVDEKEEEYIYSTSAKAIFVNRKFSPKRDIKNLILLFTDNPKMAFFDLVAYEMHQRPKEEGIQEPCYIEKNAVIGEKVFIGPFSYIGKNVKIGKSVYIYPQVYIGDNVEIGDHTILYPGVKLIKNVQIGKYCNIYAGAVLGSDGFGYHENPDRSFKKIPHIGKVILGDHVDIGVNTAIDCGTLESTSIAEGTKLDNLIHIAHNVKIGKHSAFAAEVGIAGSSEVGSYCRFAGQVGIAGHLKIGDGVVILSKSGVSKSLLQSGFYMGTPAYERKMFLKSYVIFKKLPELIQRIEKIEENINKL